MFLLQSKNNPLVVEAMKHILAKPIGTFRNEGKKSSSWPILGGLDWLMKVEQKGDSELENKVNSWWSLWLVWFCKTSSSNETKIKNRICRRTEFANKYRLLYYCINYVQLLLYFIHDSRMKLLQSAWSTILVVLVDLSYIRNAFLFGITDLL